MGVFNRKHLTLFGRYMNSSRSLSFLVFSFVSIILFLPIFSNLNSFQNNFDWVRISSSNSTLLGFKVGTRIRHDKFLEVPQIVWGLNDQKIAFARTCLTARTLNRTLLMPKLSASLFYKEVELLQPVDFDKVFQFERFNSLCKGFVQLGRYSEIRNRSDVIELHKGSGRKWTAERDMAQLRQFREDENDPSEVIRILGKNPFLWQDHWPVKDYAKVFECLVLVDEIDAEAKKVISKIREMGSKVRSKTDNHEEQSAPYVAVHMRIEKDWMIHCKNLEQRLNISQICSSKEEIMERVGNIVGLRTPIVVYLAVADSLLEDPSVLNGWKEGLLPIEKKKLGVWDIYKNHSYLIQSAIDYEVCSRADVFVGNSFSTFSSLVVLLRTHKLIRMGVRSSCDTDVRWPSYAYNILGDPGRPQKWMTDMSDSSLRRISYGSNNITC